MTDIIHVDFGGVRYLYYDTPTIQELVKEIFSDNYKIFERGLTFSPGDVVVDIGANEGVFAIMLAKMFPDIRVVACEPVPRTFYQLLRNVGLNGVTNIDAYCSGVGKEDGTIKMVVANEFSGGSSGVQQHYDPEKNKIMDVSVLSLDNFLWMAGVGRIKLMKMDIEGMEYDALYGSSALAEVQYFVGEFHTNTFLRDKGADVKELATYVGSKTNLVFYETCHMAE